MPDFVLRSEVRSQNRGNSAAALRILSSFGRPLETGGRGDQTRPARRPLRAHGSMGPRGLVEIMLQTSRLQQRWRIPWHILLIYPRHSYILIFIILILLRFKTVLGVFVSSHFPCHAPSPFGVHLAGTSGDMGSYRFHLKRVATNFLELRKYIGELEAHKRAHVRSGARRTSRKAHALLWQPRRRSSSSRPALRHLSNARGLRVGSLASQRCPSPVAKGSAAQG